MNDKRYKAKVNGLYVRKASIFWNEICLSPREQDSQYLTENDIQFLLEYFPNAEVTTFSLVKE